MTDARHRQEEQGSPGQGDVEAIQTPKNTAAEHAEECRAFVLKRGRALKQKLTFCRDPASAPG